MRAYAGPRTPGIMYNRTGSEVLAFCRLKCAPAVHISMDGKPYFLSVFHERSGKKRTDYSGYITVLDNRLRQLLGDE